MTLLAIETDRLRIRAFAPDDWPAVLSYASDPATMTYIPEGPMSEEQARAWVEENAGEEARAVALVLKPDDRPIGHLVFHPWFAHRTNEIGWVLGERYRGQGYATEGAGALLRYGFETLGLHRIIATCQPENVASWRVMEKLGLRREAHFRQCMFRDDSTWWDEYFYAILAEEWFERDSRPA
jgi:[ribosomal protein S5]-alanine N-acetyltransferase